MKKGYKVALVIILFCTVDANAQKLENILATSTCKYLDSMNIESAKTMEQKKEILILSFARAVAENEKLILSNPELKNATSYEQGKKVGQIYTAKVVPLLFANCPKFRQLSKM